MSRQSAVSSVVAKSARSGANTPPPRRGGGKTEECLAVICYEVSRAEVVGKEERDGIHDSR